MTAVALLGYGVVGNGAGRVLTENRELFAPRIGDDVYVKYVCDLRDFPGDPLRDRLVDDFNIILEDPEVKIVAEMMGGAHPAFDFSLAAIRAGKHVVTSNKQVVAEFGDTLLREANEHGVRYLFEASVGGGIPIIAPMRRCLSANDITGVTGILNGTTNYILTKMRTEGAAFDDVLADAQAKGYAEANPSADVDGIDARRKIAILGALAFGVIVPDDCIRTEGIRAITAEAVAKAEAAGYAVKLIARARKLPNGKIFMSVEPFAVLKSNILANVDDVYNSVTVTGNAVGDVNFYGHGAGKLPTASAVVSDILEIIADGAEPKTQPACARLEWNRDASVYTDILPEETAAAEEKNLGMPLSKFMGGC